MNKGIRLAVILALVSVIVTLQMCRGQVTFSRDWNAGKRSSLDSPPPPDCRNSIKSAQAVCHILVNELRQVAGCEARNLEEEGNVSVFPGGR